MSTDETKRVIDEKGRVTIPKRIRETLHLDPGEPVEVELSDGSVVIRPQISRLEFIREMEGCVSTETRRADASPVSPEALKADWTSDLPSEN